MKKAHDEAFYGYIEKESEYDVVIQQNLYYNTSIVEGVINGEV